MEEAEKVDDVGAPTKKTSHEALFGFLVMMIITVLLVLLASYGGWFLYRGVKANMSDTNRVSITDIPTGERTIERTASPEVKEASPENPTKETSVATDKKIAVKVLNGGAAKGSASTAAGVITGGGYTAVSTGNSVGDYTGVSVYFTTPATESDAMSLRELLLKKYPSSTVKASVSGNKDTTVAPLVVITGK